jgi:Carboxylesterase family
VRWVELPGGATMPASDAAHQESTLTEAGRQTVLEDPRSERLAGFHAAAVQFFVLGAFGGNPKKVTIFGESAGSEDVCAHGVFKWPPYTLGGDQRIDLDVDLSVLTGFRRRECEFWWDVYDAEFAAGSPSGAFVD